ncbi:MAG: hypothetical protein MI802_21070 [Desulfobacterales bacterium]|nr:hypothetical protein [Desulfobacterales bacterium]
MLNKLATTGTCSLYRMETETPLDCIIASTPETRAIANDPAVMGTDYTRRLQTACTSVLKTLRDETIFTGLEERETIVFNILRGGLNFGLREALTDAYGWNTHGSSFISAQRTRDDASPEEWHIVEGDYAKVYMPDTASIVIGDVVATGTSLEYAVNALIGESERQGSNLRSIIFFTIGGPRAKEILTAADARCREKFPGFERTVLVYLEGCFSVPVPDTPVRIKITGTDLLRRDAVMAPEFVESQYENPSFPLQRCTIYDAGSRAFWTPEYLEDLLDYWTRVRQLADTGVTFENLLAERFPDLDPERFSSADLKTICADQLSWVDRQLNP